MSVGIKIKSLREKKRLSQEELAQLIGVSQTTVGKWEQGKSIKHEHIKKISEVLDIPVDYLLEEKKVQIVYNQENKENSINGFEIIIKSPNTAFEELNKKLDLLISILKTQQ